MSETQVQERPAFTVVTNENKAEFVAEKLGWNKEAPEAAQVAEPVEAADSAEVEANDEAKVTEETERKPNPKIERRFSEITKQREAAKQDAERERQARIELENKLKDMEARLNPVQQESTEPDPKPKPEQFSDMFEYAESLAEWTADKRFKEEKAKEVAQRAEQERLKVLDTWSSRVNDFRAKTPDFDDLVSSADVVVSNEVRDAIFESDVGPQILYHLAENTDIAKKLQGLSATSALRMIGKLEARFEDLPASAPKETVAKTSKAPPPISPIRASANGPATELDNNRQFHGSYQAWKAARLSGRIR
jgi:hypothetical protein